ncbi:MAG: efflux RND transporter periplasmic adaptor subunit [Alphaproteobacteria bacterium]|nr:efflux RND transporter periplasmic adaptor subunit [Alphaproteobacteria bacterium]
MKRCVCLILLLAASCKPASNAYNGYVEGEFLYIAPTTPGILQTLSVARGQQVKEGDDLFALDQTGLQASLSAADAEAVQTKTSFANAASEFTRAKKLLKGGAVSQSDFDARKAAYDNAKAGLNVARQKVTQIKKQLVDSAPKAPASSVIEDTYFLAGEYVSAGSPVVSLLPPGNVKIRFFVPQAKLPLFALGSPVTISCDGCAKPVKAKISYISSQSEYTPPVIYSVGSRDKLVFRVEAKPDEFDAGLRPGLPVDILRDTQ